MANYVELPVIEANGTERKIKGRFISSEEDPRGEWSFIYQAGEGVIGRLVCDGFLTNSKPGFYDPLDRDIDRRVYAVNLNQLLNGVRK
ncbi:hypothetical protein J4402_00920 [Candidatus Pacearchaeota archaeon]|nr:hypothetical protein [Candidatus Pacearchaeota archaeon]